MIQIENVEPKSHSQNVAAGTNATEINDGAQDIHELTQKDIQCNQQLIFEKEGWRSAMNYLYNYSTKTRYIQEERLLLNIIFEKYKTGHQYHPVGFEVTINCSKPEIIAGKTPSAAHYSNFEGKCVICFENVGSEKRKGLRAFEFQCNGKQFFRQFPPYPYFNHHNIIIDKSHENQVLTVDTIRELLEMSRSMPGYKVASNSDREGTGVTNLSHRHYQAGDHPFAVYQATIVKSYDFKDQSCTVDWLKYPCCCLSIRGNDIASMEKTVYSIFSAWRTGSYPTLIQEKQTCSFISTYHEKENQYQFLLFCRNSEQPRFLTRSTLQCIKKEFVGIFELCGYAILPSRLAEQLLQISDYLYRFEQQHGKEEKISKEIYREKLFKDDDGTVNQDLSIFRDWILDYYVDIRMKHNRVESSKDVKSLLDESIQQSFITILQDNSPIKDNDQPLIESWIQQSIEKLKLI